MLMLMLMALEIQSYNWLLVSLFQVYEINNCLSVIIALARELKRDRERQR